MKFLVHISDFVIYHCCFAISNCMWVYREEDGAIIEGHVSSGKQPVMDHRNIWRNKFYLVVS